MILQVSDRLLGYQPMTDAFLLFWLSIRFAVADSLTARSICDWSLTPRVEWTDTLGVAAESGLCKCTRTATTQA
jgi:hypothetical protein